jgi:hypothetical protein
MVKRYGTSSMECENGIYVLHAEYEKVVAERDALLKELRTPLLTGANAPMYGGIFCAEGVSRDAAYSAFHSGARYVTVYYGVKRLFSSMAEFDAHRLARDCSKCGAKEVPANVYCKGMDCPLNPAKEQA